MIEVLKQALEALEFFNETAICSADTDISNEAITSLRQAIKELESQEPVATIRTWHKGGDQHAELWEWELGLSRLSDGEHKLYTTPQPVPQSEPVAYVVTTEVHGQMCSFIHRSDLTELLPDGQLLYTHPPQLEQNFCSRCGKRTNDIHTCTPPRD